MSGQPAISPPRIGIAGLGLIGASLARALAQGWPGALRLGFDLERVVTDDALTRGYIDEGAASLAELSGLCDLLVLCQPVPAVLDSLLVLGSLERLPVVCDVASVKSAVLAAATRSLGPQRGKFVGCHPIAGKANSGLAASDSALFAGRPVALCAEESDSQAVAMVSAMWERVGGHVVPMEAASHDEAYAGLSHLPQLLTWAYLRGIAGQPWKAQAGMLAGPGFESFTRLGTSSPQLWTGIVMQNRAPILSALTRAADALEDIRRAVLASDDEELMTLFNNARDDLCTISGQPGR
jgi:prephenate dehydrogenase